MDAGEIRHNAMKLAMAVDDLPPLHHQLDHAAAFPADGGQQRRARFSLSGLLDEIENDTDRAIEAAVNDLPRDSGTDRFIGY